MSKRPKLQVLLLTEGFLDASLHEETVVDEGRFTVVRARPMGQLWVVDLTGPRPRVRVGWGAGWGSACSACSGASGTGCAPGTCGLSRERGGVCGAVVLLGTSASSSLSTTGAGCKETRAALRYTLSLLSDARGQSRSRERVSSGVVFTLRSMYIIYKALHPSSHATEKKSQNFLYM